MRATLAGGSCPLAAKRLVREVWTFKDACDEWERAFGGQWKNDASRIEFQRHVGYCGGRGGIWDVPIAELGVADVVRVVGGRKSTPAVAVNVLSLVRRVVTYAAAHGHRDVDKVNPADRSLINAILPLGGRVGGRKHHAAMPYRDVPAFVSRLRERDGAKFRALEMIVLTGARKNEVLGMTFDEVDLEQGVWTVPASRMKAGRSHCVPLTARAVEIIEAQRALSRDGSGLVFPSRRGRALSRFNAFDYIDTGDATIHGFRSTLRDWLGDETDHEREAAEGILAHVVGGVEGAYRRGTGLRKRRAALEGWAEYLAGDSPVQVVGERRRGLGL